MNDKSINIGVGEMYVSSTPSIISSTIGSCICVCIFSLEAGLGGIVHFALPDESHTQKSVRDKLYYGNVAIKQLVDEILKLSGVKKNDLKAKIVGGGNVEAKITTSLSVGDLNIELARSTLQNLGIPIVGEQVGGNEGRTIFFYSDSGRLRVSKIENIQKKKVLLIDDSKTILQILNKIISSDELEVVGTAASAEEAWPLLSKLRPDVITLDIHMPGMDGVIFLEKYLPMFPIPTVMISSLSIHESDLVLKALEIGAVDYIQKPSMTEIDSYTNIIREKVLVAAKVKIKTRKIHTKATNNLISYKGTTSKSIIAIGASTGGTEAIKQVLMSLPANIPPIVIVQHIPPVFSAAFADRLSQLCAFKVKEAVDGDEVISGRALLAPGGFQMELKKIGSKMVVRIYEGERVNRHRPSVDVLFNSVATEIGKNALGIILTGMGDDGARGLLNMRKQGSYTIAQDEATSVVYGMPKVAAELKAATEISSLQEISGIIIKQLEKGNNI